jgi:hypothetical protein
MLRISVIEGDKQRRLIVEGRLVGLWAAELKSACERARTDLRARELVLDMKHLTAISQEGENVLLELLNDGIRFRCRGVFTKHVLKQLSRRATRKQRGANQ